MIPCDPEELDPNDSESARFWTQIGWNNHKIKKHERYVNVGIVSLSSSLLLFFSFNGSLDLRKNVQGQESGGYPQQRRYQCP